MKKLPKLTLLSVFLVAFTTSLVMAQEQVNSQCFVDFGGYSTCHWVQSSGGFTSVPKNMTLEVTSATFAYFPVGSGTLGRADLAGRDSGGTAVWRTQIVYIEPQKTVHLTFPGGLRLEAGGIVEMGFISGGPGTILLSMQGQLRK